MAEDQELELLRKVNSIDNFFGAALMRDDLPDWQVAKDFATFLMRQDPADVTAHLLLARACRHLGEPERAAAELNRCRSILLEGKASVTEEQALPDILAAEERLNAR
jgi:hypothetical protein